MFKLIKELIRSPVRTLWGLIVGRNLSVIKALELHPILVVFFVVFIGSLYLNYKSVSMIVEFRENKKTINRSLTLEAEAIKNQIPGMKEISFLKYLNLRKKYTVHNKIDIETRKVKILDKLKTSY